MRYQSFFKNTHSRSGFTIVELLVYVFLLALVSLVVINTLITMTRSFAESRSNRDLLDAGTTAMERMSREVRGALSVDTGNSAFDSSPGVLQLNGSGTVKVIKFSVSGSPAQLQLTEDGTVTGALTNPNVAVTSLIFRNITTAQSSAIKIEMTLQDQRGTNGRTENFYDTVILRGAY